jgi:hypothetical protein
MIRRAWVVRGFSPIFRFGDAQRGWFGVTSSGPYAYFFAAGYTDGRPGSGRPGAEAVRMPRPRAG